MRSLDRGRTWTVPVAVEPADSPENSYAVMLKVDSGRVYIFYNHNTDNVREVRRHDGRGTLARVDSLGHFVFRFSDDHGRTWSPQRHDIPVREFACDRGNVYNGSLRFFWNVGRPFVHEGSAYVSLHKVGRMGEGFFAQSEGVLLRSGNLVHETDPARITWETLPDGDVGLRTPPGGGPISEEQSYCVLSDGTFHVVYRSTDGHPVEAYSYDRGHTWTTPRYRRFADGRPMKHPRAANFAWRCANGKFLYWFHHHGGCGYDDRNPVWLCGGEEIETSTGREIRWSQPEILLYDDDPYVRMSYPDLIEEEDGTLYLTETQKSVARAHQLDPAVLRDLWCQFEAKGVRREGLILEALERTGGSLPDTVPAPCLPRFLERDTQRADYGTRVLRTGFTLDGVLRPGAGREPGSLLVDGRTPTGQGLALLTASDGRLELILNDGRTENRWTSDPGMLSATCGHAFTVIVDSGPRLILFVTDGVLHDGGPHRQFGWGRFSPHLRGADGAPSWSLGPALQSLRVYDHALSVSAAVAHHRSWTDAF
jgi:hypothetical protein